jgi:hypothetical protein
MFAVKTIKEFNEYDAKDAEKELEIYRNFTTYNKNITNHHGLFSWIKRRKDER